MTDSLASPMRLATDAEPPSDAALGASTWMTFVEQKAKEEQDEQDRLYPKWANERRKREEQRQQPSLR
jgi:hypothetical protein